LCRGGFQKKRSGLPASFNYRLIAYNNLLLRVCFLCLFRFGFALEVYAELIKCY
jgi:hypothetical protein